MPVDSIWFSISDLKADLSNVNRLTRIQYAEGLRASCMHTWQHKIDKQALGHQ